MKLLLITQSTVVDDGVVSFVKDWIDEARKNFEKVIVFALRSSDNTTIVFKKKYKVLTLLKLNWILIKYRKEYDVIFCHYSSIWAISISITAKILRKKIYQWWAHGEKNLALSVCVKLVDKVFTPSHHSFPFKNIKKTIYTGHGIKTSVIKKVIHQKNECFKIVSIGRITPVKNIDVIIREFGLLINMDKESSYSLTLIGPILNSKDEEYLNKSLNQLDSITQSKIHYIKNIENKFVYNYLLDFDIFINAQKDGGEGKAILESMSVGLPTFFHTECYKNYLKNETLDIFNFNLSEMGNLSLKILNFKNLKLIKKRQFAQELIKISDDNHNLENLWQKIFNVIKNENNKY